MAHLYILDVDFVMSKRIQVEAENEEQARAIFETLLKEDPYDYARQFDAFVGHKVINITED
jgi:hypothetical protein